MPAAPTFAALAAMNALKGTVRPALGALRDYAVGVLGADGTIPTALATLGALGGQYLLRTTAYAVTSADRGRVIDTTGTWALTLLAAASAGAGFSFVLRNLGAGTITIDPNGSETVDAATTLAVGPGASGLVICTGTAWLTLALPGSIMGAARGGNGSAAAPARSFTSDPDTGMFSVGANILGFTTAGTEQARITATGMQVTGLLTGTAVTQSATDTTANRLMKVADFGLGGGATDYSGDIDDTALATGFHFAQPASTGVKPGSFTTGLLTITRRVLRVMQVWTTDTGREFRRFYFSTAWTAWREVYAQDSILGTVSQTAGVPTGPLFQPGSGANGSFQRMADGSMICRHVLTASAAGAVTWTFPSPFFDAPVIELTAIATVSASAQMDAAPSVTAVTFSVWNSSNARRADVVHLTARGRWSDMT